MTRNNQSDPSRFIWQEGDLKFLDEGGNPKGGEDQSPPEDDSGTSSLPEDGKGPDPDLSPEEMEDAEGAWLDEEGDSPEERPLPTPPRLEGEGLQPSTREGEEKPLSAQEVKEGSEEFLSLLVQMVEEEMGGGEQQGEAPSQQGKSLRVSTKSHPAVEMARNWLESGDNAILGPLSDAVEESGYPEMAQRLRQTSHFGNLYGAVGAIHDRLGGTVIHRQGRYEIVHNPNQRYAFSGNTHLVYGPIGLVSGHDSEEEARAHIQRLTQS